MFGNQISECYKKYFQVLKSGPNEPRYKFDEPNPFVSEEEEGEVASVAYRYKKWDLGGGIVSISI